MFNDDVPARCPECGSIDVALSRTEIACHACDFSESLTLTFRDNHLKTNAAVLQFEGSFAADVLQRWGFAG